MRTAKQLRHRDMYGQSTESVLYQAMIEFHLCMGHYYSKLVTADEFRVKSRLAYVTVDLRHLFRNLTRELSSLMAELAISEESEIGLTCTLGYRVPARMFYARRDFPNQGPAFGTTIGSAILCYLDILSDTCKAAEQSICDRIITAYRGYLEGRIP